MSGGTLKAARLENRRNKNFDERFYLFSEKVLSGKTVQGCKQKKWINCLSIP